jgi:hypothetical protein
MGWLERRKERRENRGQDPDGFNWWDNITPWKSRYERHTGESSGWWEGHVETLSGPGSPSSSGGTPSSDEINYNPPKSMSGSEFWGDESIPDEYKDQVAIDLGYSTWEEAMEDLGGLPVARVTYDAEGNIVGVETLMEALQLLELRNIAESIPSFEEWADEKGFDYGGIQEKIGGLAELLEGGVPEQDIASGQEYAAQNLGFDSWEDFQAKLNEMFQRADDWQLNPEEQAEWNRATEQIVSAMREDKMQMVEALGTESTSRAFAAMDQLSSEMADVRAQRYFQKLEYEMAVKQIEFDQYLKLSEAGSGNQAQYQQMAYQNRMGALQAYATEFNNYINMFNADVNAMVAHAQTLYQSIMADIGYDTYQMDKDLALWNAEIAPIMAEYEITLMEEEMNPSWWDRNGGFVLGFLFAGLSLIPGFAPVTLPISASFFGGELTD